MQARKTVLIVDDEPAIRRFLVVALTVEGYAVVEARDGLEALDVLERAPVLPDLMLVDMMMPRMDGRELIGVLANDARLRSLPIVLLSAAQFEGGDATRQVVGWFDKPFELDRLLDCVEQVVHLGPLSQAS